MRYYSLIVVLAIILSSTFSNADSLLCSRPDNPNISKIKIDYSGVLPTTVSFQSPDSGEYRELNVNIEPVFERNEKMEESFSVKPIFDKEIDWSKEPKCYKEIGTQWYFVFRHQLDDHLVQFTPYFITEYTLCYLPRFSPQTHRLSCEFINQENSNTL